MGISVFDLFSVGVGPSSSHTVGPMRAARQFVLDLNSLGKLEQTREVRAELYGSLALTGRGHATDRAILLGLSGETPEGVDPAMIDSLVEAIGRNNAIFLLRVVNIKFTMNEHLVFHEDKFLPYHSNGMRFSAYDEGGELLLSKTFYSIGGGFIVDYTHAKRDEIDVDNQVKFPYYFSTAAELLRLCTQDNLSVRELMWRNERVLRSDNEIAQGLRHLWEVMTGCVERGCATEGILPGGLGVKRRAPSLYRKLMAAKTRDPAEVMDWLSVWALAVNEENASGGRVVTAPTNGAAGIIPSVLLYYLKFCPDASEEGVFTYLLTAAAIGILYKLGASISAAEVGCQGEVGVACSMAAAGLTAACGGSNAQVENAAEIGMEHNLGLTCDPIKGLVQIPCIERNTMGAVKAVNASRLALQGDGTHRVALDEVIATMRQTGHDMQSIYKETSQGGLAVNVTEC